MEISGGTNYIVLFKKNRVSKSEVESIQDKVLVKEGRSESLSKLAQVLKETRVKERR